MYFSAAHDKRKRARGILTIMGQSGNLSMSSARVTNNALIFLSSLKIILSILSRARRHLTTKDLLLMTSSLFLTFTFCAHETENAFRYFMETTQKTTEIRPEHSFIFKIFHVDGSSHLLSVF